MSATVVDHPLLRPAAAPAEPDELTPLAKPDWRTGMKLDRHHFQEQDRYHEDLVRYSLRLACEEPWGVAKLSVDEDALAAGHFVVKHLTALFPDGTPVWKARTIAPRAFDLRFRGRVYAALPLELPGRAMVGAAEEQRRYVREESQVADYNSGRTAVPLSWARANVRLLFEGESLDGLSVLPLARIGDPAFVPPVVRVGASPALEGCVGRIAAAARTLTTQPISAGERGAGETARLLVGATVGRFLPALASVANVHPRQAYRTLAGFVGALGAFAPAGGFAVPPFEMLDLKVTFEGLEARALEILRALSAPTHRVVTLTRADEHSYRALLQEPALLGKEFLLVVSGGDPAALHASVPRAVKVTAWEDLARAIEHHVGGVPLVSEIRRPNGIALPPQSACFRLDKRSPAWASVVKHGTLAVWLPSSYSQFVPTLIAQEASP